MEADDIDIASASGSEETRQPARSDSDVGARTDRMRVNAQDELARVLRHTYPLGKGPGFAPVVEHIGFVPDFPVLDLGAHVSCERADEGVPMRIAAGSIRVEIIRRVAST